MRLYAAATALVGAVVIAMAISTTAFAAVNKTNNQNNHNNNNQAPKVVTVHNGDSLTEIAAEFNTTYVRLFDANNQIMNPNLIYPGELLTIPLPGQQLPNRPLPSVTTNQGVEPTQPVDNDSQSTQVVSASPNPDANSSAATDPTVLPAQPQATGQAFTSSASVWDELARCESSGNWGADTGNGYYGGLQFTLSSWQAVGGSGYPNQASPNQQIYRAQLLQAQQGWGAWPVCSSKLGL
jgi:LysM repeat protein